MSYQINHAAVQRLAEREFGIIAPVTVNRIVKRRRANGWYTMRQQDHGACAIWLRVAPGDDETEYVHHVIRLDSGAPPRRIAETLAHELQHAADAEEIMRTTTEADLAKPVHRFMHPGGDYRQRPCEVRARRAGRRYGPVILRECIT